MQQLRILFTNTSFASRSGSELYVYEVAAELARRGHAPCIYSPRLGGDLPALARDAGILVVDDLLRMEWAPQLIHAQHHFETITALCHFADTPAVMFCHGIVPWESAPVRHPRILHYVAVSQAIRERIMRECAVESSRITVLPNFVDLQRFQPRLTPLPSVPRRALLFSNYAVGGGYADVISQACAQRGLSLDIVGKRYGNPTAAPETVLAGYDIVFANGRAALEALAVGAAVICCDRQGAAPLVTSANLDWFRSLNFGFGAQTQPITVEYLSEQVARYDAADAARVSARIRESAGMPEAVDRILEVYARCLAAWPLPDEDLTLRRRENAALADYLRFVSGSVGRPDSAASATPDDEARLRRLAAQNQSLSAELDARTQALRRSHEELARIQGTFTWRLRARLLRWNLPGRIYLALSSKLRRKRPTASAETAPQQEIDV